MRTRQSPEPRFPPKAGPGGPSEAVGALEVVPQPPAGAGRGGRTPVGWMGGARVMAEVERAPQGMAVRMALPQAVPYDRIRWGIYAAARLRRLAVRVVRQNGFVHIWRLEAGG